jgi:hypothetical protein
MVNSLLNSTGKVLNGIRESLLAGKKECRVICLLPCQFLTYLNNHVKKDSLTARVSRPECFIG